MRLIDADKVKEDNEVYWDLEFCHPRYEDTLKDVIENAPTVDAIEVVRCKDCKWFNALKTRDGDIKYCGKHILDSDCFNNENWFCADGERKE